jgi:hypothetical protein
VLTCALTVLLPAGVYAICLRSTIRPGEGDGDNTSQANSVKISRRETREMCRTKYKYTWRNFK